MRRALVLVLLLAGALAPPASAQSPSDSITQDAEIVLLPGGERAQLVLTLREGAKHYSPWTILMPDDMAFVEATDARGGLATRIESDKVVVSTRGSGPSYTFRVVFEGAIERGAAHARLVVDAAAPPDAATSARAILPDGWRLVGWRSSEGAPDTTGIVRGTGPLRVEYIAIPDSIDDPGPDPRVSGEAALREGLARIGNDGVVVTTRHTYDTDVMSPSWSLPLPEGATLVDVTSPWGRVPARVEDGDIRVDAPYPHAFHLGARSVDITWRLPSPEALGGTFRKTFLSVPAASVDQVTLDVELDDTLTLVGASSGKAARTGELSFVATGPLSASVTFLPPQGVDEARFDVGAFVVSAPRRVEAEARAAAEDAARLLPGAAGFLGAARLDRPFFVAYTDAAVFDWEAGFYTEGTDAIAIRASQLDAIASGEDKPLRAISTLLHETAHGLLDRLMPNGDARLSLLEEGLARLVETRAELTLEEQVITCETNGRERSCIRSSARPSAADIEKAYATPGSFDPAWSTKSVASEARGYHYDFSGLVFHHYERRAPPGALAAALADAAADRTATTDAERLVATLLAHAPALTRADLLSPGAHLRGDALRACMGPLLAPPMPWEPAPGAPRDCRGLDPARGNATVEGPAPPPAIVPPERDDDPTPTAPTPWAPASPPRVPAPTQDAASGDDVAPAAARDETFPGAATPGAGAALALVALAAALALRRRS